MQHSPNNPIENRLKEGVTEETVLQAVETSGYPLQTVVGGHLRAAGLSDVQQEWSYVDRDSGNTRTLDVIAHKPFFETPRSWRDPEGQVDASLALLIECKQSKLPYVFFLSSDKPSVRDFPAVAGIPPLKISKGGGGSIHSQNPAVALSLDRHHFVSDATWCAAFAKCSRKGKDLELSGNEPFNNLVLPLSKALDYFVKVRTRAKDRRDNNYLCTLALALGVLDAPMVGIRVTEEGNEAILLPWVRVVRHETRQLERSARGEDRLIAVDVIHKDFLARYLGDHLLPFAESFSYTVEDHQESIRSGKGRGVGGEPRLAPRVKPS